MNETHEMNRERGAAEKGWDGLTLVSAVARHAQTQPEKPALILKQKCLTYRELSDRVEAAGACLGQMGIGAGERVLFTTLSNPEMAVVYLGIQYIGGIAVFVDKNTTPENCRAIYEDTRASLFLTDQPMKEQGGGMRLSSLRGFTARAEEAALSGEGERCPRSVPRPEDVAEMIFTTGTTGRPKGVMLSYRALRQIWRNNIEGVGLTKEDRTLIPLPLCHSLGIRMLRVNLYLGASVVLQNGFTFAKELEQNIVGHGCTVMITVPASFELVKNQMREQFAPILGRLRSIEVGAGSLSLRQKKEFDALLPDTRLTNTWGSSETGGAIFLDVHTAAKNPLKVGAIGRPLPGVEVEALGSDGRFLSHTDPDHPGRLALRGDMIMSGYWDRPELTKDALRDGFLVTNDLVWFDEDGYVYMLGRADDIINVGGEKVSPIEVENIASEYPAVKECACIGVPDPGEVLGQVPVLLLAVDETYGPEGDTGLKAFLSARMERFKLPAYFLQVEELPRNRMKKPDRKAMRRLWEASRAGFSRG